MQLRALGRVDQLAFTELVDMARDAAFDRDYPASGSFHKRHRAGRDYWYYQRHVGMNEDGSRQIDTRYVGKVGDAEVERRIAAFGEIKETHRIRRRLVTQLRGAGLPTPLKLEGDIIEALAQAGLFRVNGVLIGSMAYQTYGGMLGIRLPSAALVTQDADFAQDHGISLHVDDQTDDIIETLHRVDPSFRPVPSLRDPLRTNAFANGTRFKVEFLTSSRGSDEQHSGLTRLPAIAGSGAVPLRYLDFLIRDPITSVVLHGAGISVLVPTPERYGVHKLIVASQRTSSAESAAKAVKDITQAEDLIAALSLAGRQFDLSEAWAEAWERGPSWRENLAQGAMRMKPDSRLVLRDAVATFSEDHGLTKDRDPVETLKLALA
jgi:hypothetical protein